MSKSVLVINTPKYCDLCVLRSGVHHPFCRVNNRDITDLSIRPDWCPLQPLPEALENRFRCKSKKKNGLTLNAYVVMCSQNIMEMDITIFHCKIKQPIVLNVDRN